MTIALIVILTLIAAFIVYIKISLKKFKNSPASVTNPKIINLDDKNFNSITKGNIALVDFWAEWCAPCKMMNPILNELANEVNENVVISKVNVDIQRNLAAKFGVRSIPTMILLKNGKEVSRFVGVKPKHFLLTQLSLIK